MVAGKSQAQNNNGQASPAPFQNRASENEQNISSSVRPIGGNSNSAAANSSDRKNEVKNEQKESALLDERLVLGTGCNSVPVDYQRRNMARNPIYSVGNEVNNDQNTNANPDSDGNPCDSRPDHNPGSSNRTDDEVKNGRRMLLQRKLDVSGNSLSNSGNSGFNLADSPAIQEAEIAPSARLSAPANQASFDAADYHLPHVQNEQENQESATCANSPELEPKQDTLTGRELTEWAMENYAVDPIQNSKNRWRIRLRCRKTGCKHEGHLGLKTVSFMSDSAFKKLTKSGRKYELWKKSIIAENAAKCHGYGGSSSGRNDERRA